MDYKELSEQIVSESDKELEANFAKHMQSMMMIGGAESLINNDNGMWAIGSGGCQNVICGDEPDDLSTVFQVDKKLFRKTIAGALRAYAQETLDDWK